jgi:hypothetical protein
MVTVTLCLIGVLPSILVWLHARILRRLSESRLVIAESVTQIEELLLARAMTTGDASHDVLFRQMAYVQNADYYSINWAVLRRPPQHIRDFRKSLEAELGQEDCQFRNIVHAFACHYFRAFRFKHPVKCMAYIIWLFTIAGGLGSLLLLLQTVVAALKGYQQVKAAAKRVRNLTAETFVALAFSVNRTQWHNQTLNLSYR